MRKVLIANRGEIARRVIAGARTLGLRTAAVYADPDADAWFVRDADEAVRLPGSTAANTYLSIELLLGAAAAVGADAVHPGYGFLSENADFAAACIDAGLTFVGPTPDAIRRMGDKLGAKAIMAANGVPVLASVTVDDGHTPDVDAISEQVGYPAIVKATAGGGGRGMRIVTAPADLELALDGARREAQAAFGNSTVFIERYISPARHIEVQVLADSHGQVATLFERECSIQRRHQKLVEEAPSSFVDDELRQVLMTAAAKAAHAVDYLGAGTVEFVVGADRTVAFLEMNTRLQVEHPVTEKITGIDLVRAQFQVAAGEPLPPEILTPTRRGHAIEVRLCAEDPENGHLPASGEFLRFEVDETAAGVRVDTGVESGSTVSPYYDSMVAKVIAWGETRREAAARLADVLSRARIHGVANNRDLLVRILRSDEFVSGDTTTDFLERVSGLTSPLTTREIHVVHAAASAAVLNNVRSAAALVQPGVPAGWRNNRTSLEHVELSNAGEPISLDFDLTANPAVIEVDGKVIDAVVHGACESGVDMTIDGVRRRYLVDVLADRVLVDSPLGSSTFRVVPRLPLSGDDLGAEGGLTAPMPGTVMRTMVTVGQAVESGDPLLVLEAMKMEHTICSPNAGTVTAINVSVGDQVERDAVLAEVSAS